MSKRAVVGIGCAFVLLAALSGVGGTPARGADAPAASGHVGSAVCAPCHEAAHKAWAPSWHAGSVREVRASEFPKDALAGRPVRHGPGTTTFRAEGERVVASTVGPDGAVHDYPVDYVVGGRRVTMLLTRLPERKLQVMPSMRDESRGAWFDYTALIFGAPGLPHEKAPEVKPGDGSFWTGPVRSFESRCARCHFSPTVDPATGTSAAPVEPGRLGVSCEACHGPGKAHVDFWRAQPKSPQGDPVVRLGALEPARRLDACLACHLEGEVVDPAWAPGKAVLEHVDPTLLDETDRVDETGRPVELIYEGLQLLTSTCAIAGRLQCTSCHDAHGTDRTAMLVADPKGTDLCASCHAKESSDPRAHSRHDPRGSGASCLACHMPPVAVERGNGHVTDHTIGVPRPSRQGAVPGRAVDACTGCHTGARGFPSDVPRLPSERIVEAYEAWYPKALPHPWWSPAIAAGRGAPTPEARKALEGLLASPTAPELVRASAARLLARQATDATAALARALKDPSSLVRRSAVAALEGVRTPEADAALLAALGDPSTAVRARAARTAVAGYDRAQANRALLEASLPVLEADARAWPLDDQRWFRLGAAREMAGDLAGAVEAYRRQVALDPSATTIAAYVGKLEQRLKGAPPGK